MKRNTFALLALLIGAVIFLPAQQPKSILTPSGDEDAEYVMHSEEEEEEDINMRLLAASETGDNDVRNELRQARYVRENALAEISILEDERLQLSDRLLALESRADLLQAQRDRLAKENKMLQSDIEVLSMRARPEGAAPVRVSRESVIQNESKMAEHEKEMTRIQHQIHQLSGQLDEIEENILRYEEVLESCDDIIVTNEGLLLRS